MTIKCFDLYSDNYNKNILIIGIGTIYQFLFIFHFKDILISVILTYKGEKHMHFAIGIVIIMAVLIKKAWKDWRTYHATMLFFGFMELIYNLLVESRNHFLWKVIPDLYMNRVTTIGIYVFIIFPGTVLLYFRALPYGIKGQIKHIAMWVVIYTGVEYIGVLSGKIEYFYGWDIFHSFIFNIALFLGLILHHKKPLIAYPVFIAATILGVWAYKIPI